MKTPARLIIIMAMLLGVVHPALAGLNAWHKIAFDKNHVVFLASDPARAATLYAATTLGLMKSLDSGAGWEALPGLPQQIPPSAVAINPHNSNVIFVAFDGLGLFKSEDAGQTWQPSDMGLPTLSIRCITISPNDPNLMYLGILGGVAVSTNGGKYWHMTSGLKQAVNVNRIAIDPKNPQYLYAATGGAGVFKSGNGGVSWRDINDGLSSLSIMDLYIDPENPDILLAGAYHPATPTDLYVGSASGGVFRSEDGGRTWQGSSLLSITIFAFTSGPDYPGLIYAGAWGGTYRSVDKGKNWTDINAGLDNAFPHTVHMLPGKPPTLLAGTTFGLLSYTDDALDMPSGEGESTEIFMWYGLGGAALIALLLAALFMRLRRGGRKKPDEQRPVW